MAELVYLSMATACVSFTVTESKLFEPVRAWMATKSRVLGKLCQCGYCLGHWVALALTAIYAPRVVVSGAALADFLVAALCVAWLAGLQWAAFCWMMRWTGK